MMMQVMMAVGVCAAITLGLTVFAFQTKIDFTAMGGETQHVNMSDNLHLMRIKPFVKL